MQSYLYRRCALAIGLGTAGAIACYLALGAEKIAPPPVPVPEDAPALPETASAPPPVAAESPGDRQASESEPIQLEVTERAPQPVVPMDQPLSPPAMVYAAPHAPEPVATPSEAVADSSAETVEDRPGHTGEAREGLAIPPLRLSGLSTERVDWLVRTGRALVWAEAVGGGRFVMMPDGTARRWSELENPPAGRKKPLPRNSPLFDRDAFETAVFTGYTSVPLHSFFLSLSTAEDNAIIGAQKRTLDGVEAPENVALMTGCWSEEGRFVIRSAVDRDASTLTFNTPPCG